MSLPRYRASVACLCFLQKSLLEYCFSLCLLVSEFSVLLDSGISYNTDELGLREAFSKYGQYLHGRRLSVSYATERASGYVRRGSLIYVGRHHSAFFPARGYRGGSSYGYGGNAGGYGGNAPYGGSAVGGNATDHQLESAVDEQFGGSDNQFGGSENGQTEVGPDGFDQTDDGDVAERA
ncbi:hypothetical protein Bca4012_027597 [Brassica carinata]